MESYMVGAGAAGSKHGTGLSVGPGGSSCEAASATGTNGSSGPASGVGADGGRAEVFAAQVELPLSKIADKVQGEASAEAGAYGARALTITIGKDGAWQIRTAGSGMTYDKLISTLAQIQASYIADLIESRDRRAKACRQEDGTVVFEE